MILFFKAEADSIDGGQGTQGELNKNGKIYE
jgi:hypothetical protein